MPAWPPRPVGRPAKPKTFKFSRRSRGYTPPSILQPNIMRTDEALTGFVRGYNASDIEERFARALIKIDLGFWFQYKLDISIDGDAGRGLPGDIKRLDFLVFWMPGKIAPVEVYGDRWHNTTSARNRDRDREQKINELGKKFDWEKLQIVWGHDLTDQNAADQIVRRMFI